MIIGNLLRISSLISCPKATTTPQSAPTSNASAAFSETRSHTSDAACFTAVPVGADLRLLRRSGIVITRGISNPASTSFRKLGTAASGVPRKTIDLGCSGGSGSSLFTGARDRLKGQLPGGSGF